MFQPAHPPFCHTRLSLGWGRGRARALWLVNPGPRRYLEGAQKQLQRNSFASLQVQHSHCPADGDAAALFRHPRGPGRGFWVIVLGGSEAVMLGICKIQGSWMTELMCRRRSKNIFPWGKVLPTWVGVVDLLSFGGTQWLCSLVAKKVPKV